MPDSRSHERAQPSRSRPLSSSSAVEQVGERGVAPGVPVEVAAHAGEEGVLAEVGRELAQRGGALGVGDAVEVEQGRAVVGHRTGDRVGGREGVGAVAPRLAGEREVLPRAVVVGGAVGGEHPHVLREGLVEPEVVPPPHRHQVAEPHVRELVGDDLGAEPALAARRTAPRDEVLVGEGDQAGVLHRPGVEVGDEHLVVGRAEGHRPAEERLLEVQALRRHVQDLVGLEVRLQRGPAPDPELEVAVPGRLDRARARRRPRRGTAASARSARTRGAPAPTRRPGCCRARPSRRGRRR